MHSFEGIESFLSMPRCPVWVHIFIIVTAVWHGVFAGVWRFLCFAKTNFAIRTDWCFLLEINFLRFSESIRPSIDKIFVFIE